MSVFKLKKWPSRRIVTSCTLLISLLFSSLVFAAGGRLDYDLDDDGLIEINDLADLNEIRNSLKGKSLYGSSAGCVPACNGFELNTLLDFDTNSDGVMDSNDTYWSPDNDGVGKGWLPIGSQYSHFTAKFDGNGHQILNLYINRASSNYVGLFGSIYDAHIRNLELTGPLMFIAGSSYVGGLVGDSTSSYITTNMNTGSVQGDSDTGGLIGYSDRDLITYNTNTGSVRSAFRTGGLAGSSKSSQIEKNINTGPVQGDSSIGGLVGRSYSSQITNNLNTGSTQGHSSIGGLVGNLDSSRIDNTISTGFVSGHLETGGLVGHGYRNTISNSYWATDSSGQTDSRDSSEASSYVGLTLATLQCAVQANTSSDNSNCVSSDGTVEGLSGPVTLFNQWEQAIQNGQNLWDFGGNTQLPALHLKGALYRDSDGDGSLDSQDAFPNNRASSIDNDNDGYPDRWTTGCDTECIGASGLTLDQLPLNDAAWQDNDLDGLPDTWANSCDSTCQSASGLVLDTYLNDTDNDSINNLEDTDDNGDGFTDVDANSNGLIDINNLGQLNAIRHQLDGGGLRLTEGAKLDQSGCPVTLYQGTIVRRCAGYELSSDLDFDSNQDKQMDSNDAYWNANNDGIGEGWLPIGNSGSKFSALFEGNGHKIRNLYINQTSNDYIGLFGYIHQADIRNVVLTGPLMTISGGDYVGSLAGHSDSSQISNILNTGSVQGSGYIGGLLGRSVSSQITNSMNTSSVKGDNIIGGLVGFSDSNRISNTISTGFVSGISKTGGLIGDRRINKENTVTNSYWANDSSGQVNSSGSSETTSYVGLTLTTLQCAVQANTNSHNSNCVSSDGITEGLNGPATLFNQWDQAHWDFGSNSQLPALRLNGTLYRDSDGDGSLDIQDHWPNDPAASFDTDGDGFPDRWTTGCDATCITASGLILDQFLLNGAAGQDSDLDGLPDSWSENCDGNCQRASGLTPDIYLNDSDNDGLSNLNDTDDNNDGIIDADANSNGLIDINNLEQLNAMRHQLDGGGLRLAENAELDQSGCPSILYQGVIMSRCVGYELTADLDFDSNRDGTIDTNDTYWNANSDGLGEGWLSIGNSDSKFSAMFEGNGHEIRNLHINQASNNYIGLFGYIDHADIRNVILTGPLMSVAGGHHIGSLVGYSESSQIFNIINTGSVQGSYSIGGLIGRLESSQVTNSINNGPVQSFTQNPGTYPGTGGLVGASDSSLITNSMNTGSVQSMSYHTGGIVGHSLSSHIKNTISTGFIFADSSLSGGLFGGGAYNTISNSYWAIDSSGQATSIRSSEAASYVGVPLATLQCAVQANTNSDNSTCVSSDGAAEGLLGAATLFNLWDQAIWDFGTAIQLPALVINGTVYRDSDGDGALDEQDVFPNNRAASIDVDNDGYPDDLTTGCDSACLAASGLILDQFLGDSAAGQDNDLDGLPDEWAYTCDATCRSASNLVIDNYPNDTDNDGLSNLVDTDDNNDGFSDIDTNSNGLIDINSLEQLNAMRYQLDGSGFRLVADAELDQSGCPASLYEGKIVLRCVGYELTTDLDFDTNQDGAMDVNDTYWHANSDGTGEGWLPIGSLNSKYSGLFEGNGHQIRNLYINRASSDDIGLFGYIHRAAIRNLVLTGPLMSVRGKKRVGSLAGASGFSQVSNIINTGSVQSTADSTGGLIGSSGSSQISNCLNTGSVQGANNSYDSYSNTGGLIGYSGFDQIHSSMNTGSIQGYNHTGGLVGFSRANYIHHTINTGLVSGGSVAGGLVGLAYTYGDSNTFNNNYWATDSSGQASSFLISDNTSGGISRTDRYTGVTLARLQCAIQANTNSDNSSCVSSDGTAEGLDTAVTLFKQWNKGIQGEQASWDFGTNTQLPGLFLNGILYRDSDGDGSLDENDALPFDSDNDGISNQQDFYPFIAIGHLADTDNDGAPDTCDENCLASGMLADTDADNDGIQDNNDAYPLIAIGELLDTDNDGAPDTCDADCLTSGMNADTDDDNDGVPDTSDDYPLISIGDLTDTDNDGAPDTCDANCLASGMSADTDADNDGIQDDSDAYPLIAIGDLTDTDNDGAPDTCDLDCLTLGMAEDLDDDNDGVFDSQDKYPLISLDGRLDSDSDGIPNECDEACTVLGMTTDLDDDNDDILDVNDSFPLVSIGELLDTDNDGVPNTCDIDCLALGMTTDLDDDNDGVLDTNDFFPLVSIGELLDTDNDGAPNTCDADCLALGMFDDLDDDNDGVLDTNDVYPLITFGNLLDSDNDGAPDTCDADCIVLGMSADLDDDNDGILDVNDAFSLIAIGDLLDTDNDGAPDTCDTDCVASGMNADTDDDNDGVLDVNDTYPLIAIGSLLDTDNDGTPNTCDTDCLALGMTEDLDDDNDGIYDSQDAYPTIAINGFTDTDNDGAPDTCNADCIVLGMSADLDDDNDGILDVNDAFSLIAIGDLLDTDTDGAPDTCDTDCVASGMNADTDDDNDGVLDVNDAYPLIAIGSLLDTDNDGTPNTCDTDCLALGMTEDLDDDNDGIYDSQDAYPTIAIKGLTDTDNDGAPNECPIDCVNLGMSEDLDDDNDGLLDIDDSYPTSAIGEQTDTDNDGAPDTCDTDCVASGMNADTDDDNDGVLDVNDAYPLIAIGSLLDTDNDGTPNTCDTDCLALGMTEDLDDDNDGVTDINDRFPLDSSEHSDFDNDGQGDVADLDDDNDGVNDVDDPNLGADNGAPVLLSVTGTSSFAVTSDNGFTYDLLADENFFMAFLATDARDTTFTYEASLNGSPLSADENDIMLIPAGRHEIQWVAMDTSGNRSEPLVQIINVYPQVRFDKSTSIIGEASFTEIKVRLTGDAPAYPVVMTFKVNDTSDADQDDLNGSFDITAQHQVIIEAGDAESLNREAFINIPIIEDNESENDELLILDLVSAKIQSESDDDIESLFTVNEDNQQHELTITYQNLAPTVQFKLEQNGLEVANIQQDGGMVTLTAVVQDGNGGDVHTFIWDIDSLGLNAPLGSSISFDPINLAEGTYDISVTATDNGIGQLSDDALLSLEIIAPEQEGRDSESTASGGSGGGAMNAWLMLLMFGLLSSARVKRRCKHVT